MRKILGLNVVFLLASAALAQDRHFPAALGADGNLGIVEGPQLAHRAPHAIATYRRFGREPREVGRHTPSVSPENTSTR